MDAIKEIEAALAAGPTDGPWTAHFEEAYFVRGPDLGRLAMAQNLRGPHGLGGRRSGNESAANIKLISACNPANMRQLLAEYAAKDEIIQSQGDEISRLKSAVEPFANIAYFPHIVDGMVLTLDSHEQQTALLKAFANARASLALSPTQPNEGAKS